MPTIAPASRVAALLVCLLLSFSSGFSQTTTTGDIAGVVDDQSNAAIPNAAVTLKDNETGSIRTTKANGLGEFHFTFLRPGRYELAATSAGLKSDLTEINVAVGRIASATLVARVEATQQTLEVTGAAELIDTESPNIGATIPANDIAVLPIPGEDITSIVFTTPGVSVSTGGGYGNFSVHGLPATSNVFTLNGNDNNDAYLNLSYAGASNLLLGANEVQEVTIVLNPYSVQYGRQAGAQIDYVTKSGTNAFHGNLLWNWNGDRLNANPFFNNANGVGKPRAVSNQYAASLGGPVKKNKLFFFANTEGIRYTLPAAGFVTIPSAQLQAFTLANIAPAQVPLYQKAFSLWNNAPGAAGGVAVTNGNGSLQDSTGALGCGDLAGTPAPNGGIFGTDVSCGKAWAANGSNLNAEWLMMTRVDYNINDRQRIGFRYKGDHGVQPTATSLITPTFNIQSKQPEEEGQFTHNWTISPNMVNNLIASVSWYSAFFSSPDMGAAVSAFPFNFFLSSGGSNGATGFTQMGDGAAGRGFDQYPQGRNVGQAQITDDFSYIEGRHQLKAGVNFRRDRITDSSLLADTNGFYDFSSLADFSTGQLVNGSYYLQSFPRLLAAHIRYNAAGVYVQDEWSVRPNLRITAGLRFDTNPNPSCADSCFARLNGQFSSDAFAKGIDIPYNQSITSGLAKAYPSTQAGVLQPRVGIVWSPKSSWGTVVRAGFGLFTDLAPANLASNIFNNAPNSFATPIFAGNVNTASDPTSAAAIAANGAAAFRSGFTQGLTYDQLNTALAAIGGFAPPTFFSTANNMLAPKYLEYSFEIQQPLGRKNVLDVIYTGNHGRDLPVIDPTVNGFGFAGLPAAAPDPRFSAVTELTNGGSSNYNGVTAALHRTLGYGLKGEISYTWSHSLDDTSGLEPYNYTNNNLSLGQLVSPYGPKANYGNSDYDIRHYLAADFIWALPFKRSNKLLREVAGGWTLSSRFTLHTGVPFTPYDLLQAFTLSGQNVSPGNYNGFLPTAISGVSAGCGAGAVNTPCFTAADFVPAGAETAFGNIGRNSFRGPGYFDWDASLYKAFTIRGKYSVVLGATAYNLTNHANFDAPSADIFGSGLGLIDNTVSAPTSAYGASLGSAVSARIAVLSARFQF